MLPLEGEGEGERPVCSARGCRDDARWVLAWNNPKLHTPDRRKTWLACDAHREKLESFLGVRGLWKETVAFATWTARTPQHSPTHSAVTDPQSSQSDTPHG